MVVNCYISTHTSRVGCDTVVPVCSITSSNFYSHIPCGMWRFDSVNNVTSITFLLTHPVWDVTDRASFFGLDKSISTHTSRVGCDSSKWYKNNPDDISTHTSRVGCDQVQQNWIRCIGISTHTSRVGCDSSVFNAIKSTITFLLTHPVWDVTWRRCHTFLL